MAEGCHLGGGWSDSENCSTLVGGGIEVDIKQELRQLAAVPRLFGQTEPSIADIAKATLAEIEGLEKTVKPNMMRTEMAVQMMAAQVGSDYHSNRLYDFEALARDAVDAADALIRELHRR